MSTTRSRRVVAAAVAGVVLAVVVAQEALTPAPYHHARSSGALALMAVLAALVLVFVPRVRSLSVAVGGGIAAGGALAMFVSGLVWHGESRIRSSAATTRSISPTSPSSSAT